MLDTADVEPGIREQQRVGEAERDTLQLEVDDGDLCHSGTSIAGVGSGRQVEDGPATGRRHHRHTRIRVHHERVPHCSEQRGVVHAVAVGVALGQRYPVSSGPLGDGCQLAGAPHERADDGAVVGAVGVHAVARGHHIVEAEQVGERFHHVVGRGGGHHHRAARSTVFGEQRLGQRLHHGAQRGRSLCSGTFDRGLRLAPGQHRGLAGQRHRRDSLANGVEQLEQQRLARDRPADQASGLHGLREHLA